MASAVDDLRRQLDVRQREGTTPDQIEITQYGDGTTMIDEANRKMQLFPEMPANQGTAAD